GVCLFLRNVVALGERRRQVLEGYGGLRGRLGRRCCLRGLRRGLSCGGLSECHGLPTRCCGLHCFVTESRFVPKNKHFLRFFVPWWGSFRRRCLWHGDSAICLVGIQASTERQSDVRCSLLADAEWQEGDNPAGGAGRTIQDHSL